MKTIIEQIQSGLDRVFGFGAQVSQTLQSIIAGISMMQHRCCCYAVCC